jgi:uncharacterized protein YbgA (DUF1722 family)
VEEEGRLHDPKLRENFIERVFALKRWRETISKKQSLGQLVDFHTKNKLLILSHNPATHQAMGKLLARGKQIPLQTLYEKYQTFLTQALKLRSTAKKNTNVLQHMLGYFKEQLSPDEKQEMLEIIDQYRQGLFPLIVPLTLMNHYVRKYDQPYLKEQSYLNPHPVELQLRNHV